MFYQNQMKNIYIHSTQLYKVIGVICVMNSAVYMCLHTNTYKHM